MNTPMTEQPSDANPHARPAVPPEQTAAAAGVAELTMTACWQLVESGSIGRLAVDSYDGRPDVYPVNYLVHSGAIYVRSAPGSKLRSIAVHPACAFEVDGTDDESIWSVVIRGEAVRLDTDADIEASGILELVSWSPTHKHDFVRFTPHTMSGRRFARTSAPPEVAAAFAPLADAATDDSRHVTAGKPQPIPHFAPLSH